MPLNGPFTFDESAFAEFDRWRAEKGWPDDVTVAFRIAMTCLQMTRASVPEGLHAAGSLTRRVDGPQPPDWFWWNGKKERLPTQAFQLLCIIWNEDSVSIDAVIAAWGAEAKGNKSLNLKTEKSRIGNAIKAVNDAARALGCPLILGQKNGYVCKRSEP